MIEFFCLLQGFGIEFEDGIQHWPQAVVLFNPLQVEFTESDGSQIPFMHQLLKGSDAFLLKVQSCFLQSNASGVGQYLQRGFFHQILDLFTVGQHVGGLDMGLQIFQ